MGLRLLTLEGRRLQNEELHGLVPLIKYYWGIESKYNEMGGTIGTYVERRGASRVLVDKPEGKKPLERPRCRWEDNTKTDTDAREHGLD
jgi:hypothetical protein